MMFSKSSALKIAAQDELQPTRFSRCDRSSRNRPRHHALLLPAAICQRWCPKFSVEHGIDQCSAKRAEAVLKAEAGKQAAFVVVCESDKALSHVFTPYSISMALPQKRCRLWER
jgi:hypothetical protein